jgi:hypothetical protein
MIEDPDAAPVRQLVPTTLVVRASSGANGAPRAAARENKEVG